MNASSQNTTPTHSRSAVLFEELLRRTSRTRPPRLTRRTMTRSRFRIVGAVEDPDDGSAIRYALHRRGDTWWVRPGAGAPAIHRCEPGGVVDAELEWNEQRKLWSMVGGQPVPADAADIRQLELADPRWGFNAGDLRQLLMVIDTLSPAVQATIHAVFADECDARAFLVQRASLQHHHAYDGGLLRHTLEVAVFAEALRRSPEVDRDVLLAAAILHDVGKTREYATAASGWVSRTEEGRLLCHKQIGKSMFDHAAARTRLDPAVAWRIGHCLVAADGPRYMGLPDKQLVEAYLLSAADSASAAQDTSPVRR